MDSSEPSVDRALIGRFVDATVGIARVEVRHEGRLVTAHNRVWARSRTVTDPAHDPRVEYRDMMDVLVGVDSRDYRD